MRKISYITIGIILGIALTVGTTAFGEGLGLVGKKVAGEYELSINGKDVGTYINVEGKAYGPIRLIGESAGFVVGYNDDKKVTLDSPLPDAESEGGSMENTELESENPNTEIQNINDKLEEVRKLTLDIQDKLILVMNKMSDNHNDADLKAEYDILYKQAEELHNQKVELETQLDELLKAQQTTTP